MAILVVNGLRALFAALGCAMVTTLIYTISIDGLPFRMDLLTPWMGATLVDFYINIGALGAWICYKESNWIRALLWLVLLVCLGSITTCAYILMQLFKLSPQEYLEDPIYYVLLRHPNKDATERNKKCCRVVTARVVFSILGILMFGTLVFTIVTDGSPFRAELFTPWLTATLVDFYINIVALSVWVTYKEPSWLHAIVWISLLICFGSVATCVYIVYQLHQLASQDPLYLVLLNGGNRLFFLFSYSRLSPELMDDPIPCIKEETGMREAATQFNIRTALKARRIVLGSSRELIGIQFTVHISPDMYLLFVILYVNVILFVHR